MSDSKPLTAKQEAFCRYYVSNGFNATEAAISAGYAEDSARQEGSRLLTNADIKNFIESLKAPIIEKTTLTAARLAQMVDECLEFDLTNWFDIIPPTFDDDGKVKHRGGLFLKCALSDLPIAVRQIMVQGFKQTKFGTEVNLVSKQFLLDMKARFNGMYKDQLKVTNDYEKMTDEEVAARLEALAKDE